jgi:hypothetical protein
VKNNSQTNIHFLAQLLKKKTNKEFSGGVLKDIRDKYSQTDSSSFFADVGVENANTQAVVCFLCYF